jgi:hypothetical protein
MSDKKFNKFIQENKKDVDKNIKKLSSNAKEIWNNIPMFIWNIYEYFIDLMSSLIMEMRAYLIDMLTEDLKHIEIDRSIWERANLCLSQNHKSGENILKVMFKKIRVKYNDDKTREHTMKIYKFIEKKEVKEYLNYCIKYQKDEQFIKIRDRLMKYLKINEKGEELLTEMSSNQTDSIRRVKKIEVINNNHEFNNSK